MWNNRGFLHLKPWNLLCETAWPASLGGKVPHGIAANSLKRTDGCMDGWMDGWMDCDGDGDGDGGDGSDDDDDDNAAIWYVHESVTAKHAIKVYQVLYRALSLRKATLSNNFRSSCALSLRFPPFSCNFKSSLPSTDAKVQWKQRASHERHHLPAMCRFFGWASDGCQYQIWKKNRNRGYVSPSKHDENQVRLSST